MVCGDVVKADEPMTQGDALAATRDAVLPVLRKELERREMHLRECTYLVSAAQAVLREQEQKVRGCEADMQLAILAVDAMDRAIAWAEGEEKGTAT